MFFRGSLSLAVQGLRDSEVLFFLGNFIVLVLHGFHWVLRLFLQGFYFIRGSHSLFLWFCIGTLDNSGFFIKGANLVLERYVIGSSFPVASKHKDRQRVERASGRTSLSISF